MSAISNYLESKIVNHVLRNIAYTSPATVYVALYETNPTDADTGKELSGGSYARILCTGFTVGQYGTANPSYTNAFNTNNMMSPTVTGSGWQTVSYIGIRDSLTTGNLLFYGALTTPIQPLTGQNFYIPAGQLKIELRTANTSTAISGFSAYLSQKILNHVLNNVTYTCPGLTSCFSLYSTHPQANDLGGTEIIASDYIRQPATWSPPGSTSGSTGNSGSIVFSASSTLPWGNVVGIGVKSSMNTTGNILFYTPLQSNRTINMEAGDGFKINTHCYKIYVD